jgi:hypothetical protein
MGLSQTLNELTATSIKVSEFIEVLDHPIRQDGKFKGVIDNPTPLNVSKDICNA